MNPMILVQRILELGVDGMGPWTSAAALAATYRDDARYFTVADRIRALRRWETTRAATTGALAAAPPGWFQLGAIPANMIAQWAIQARIIGAIAELHGYSTKDERVRAMVLLALLGDGAREALKEAGIEVAERLGMRLLKAIPGSLVLAINRAVGFRLVTIAGKTGVVNLMKLVPLLGIAVGATVDGLAARWAADAAESMFG